MVKFVGFTDHEESLIRGLVERFGNKNYQLHELKHVKKSDMPGYNGFVIPKLAECGKKLEMTMHLSSCSPFTIAHELAHVSDITVRRKDSIDNLSCEMPSNWHLAYKMLSEYYANRVACDHSGKEEIFSTFRSDAAMLLSAAKKKEWGQFLINYSLLLGILHGIGRPDCEPMSMLPIKNAIPLKVIKAMTGFKQEALDFFDGYENWESLPVAA